VPGNPGWTHGNHVIRPFEYFVNLNGELLNPGFAGGNCSCSREQKRHQLKTQLKKKKKMY